MSQAAKAALSNARTRLAAAPEDTPAEARQYIELLRQTLDVTTAEGAPAVTCSSTAAEAPTATSRVETRARFGGGEEADDGYQEFA